MRFGINKKWQNSAKRCVAATFANLESLKTVGKPVLVQWGIRVANDGSQHTLSVTPDSLAHG
jgi:hypothetical protein